MTGALTPGRRILAALDDELVGLPPMTMSAGIAVFPQDGLEPEALLRRAEAALAIAKKLGGDRVLAAGDDALPGLPHAPQAHDPALTAALRLAEALDLRDAGTALHGRTVGRYAELMARGLGLAPALVARVRLAGLLHDVGKIAVPDAILHKLGPLTPEEWEVMRRHPEAGARLLDGEGLADIRGWVHAHHERPDGSGYPRGLREEEIPLPARILAVADAYEAMTTDRPYRRARPEADARAELRRHGGSQWDPAVVDALLAALTELAPAPLPSG